MNLKRRERERQRGKHERIRESIVEWGPGRTRESRERERVKLKEKSGKTFKPEKQTKIASQTDKKRERM